MNRISIEEGRELFHNPDIYELLSKADRIKNQLHGNRIYYSNSLNFNPTNICRNKCGLCAYYRDEDSPDSYFEDLDSARKKIIEAGKNNLTEIHIVGGLYDKCGIEYYEKLFSMINEILPDVIIKGLTAVEIDALSQKENISVRDVFVRLKDAGLKVMPGGGAEIFSERARKQICPRKISAERWLSIHEEAHQLSIPSNATMLFGHIETSEEIVDHLERLRNLQDKTSGFQTFIPLPFHPDGTKLDVKFSPAGIEFLRITAFARIYLDNFSHIRVLSNYTDKKLLQVLLNSGVDDIGGTSFDEKIALAAGASNSNRFGSQEEMRRFIIQLGFEPVYVNSLYEEITYSCRDMTGREVVIPVSPSVNPAKTCRNKAGISNSSSISRMKIPTFEGMRSKEESTAANNAAFLISKIENNERILESEAIELFDLPLYELGRLANKIRNQKNPADRITFVIDRNISLTNVCVSECDFCAYYVPVDSEKAFTLSQNEIIAKIGECEKIGGTQILIQGGLNPEISISFFEELFRRIKSECSNQIWLHSLSPTEINYLAKRERISIEEVLIRLKNAGLDSLPGGGAEILVGRIRQKVSPRKISVSEWFEVMKTAHKLGMKSTATMVYGLGESIEERIKHLILIRELQDETNGFTAFIPWSFQPSRTRISITPATGVDYLKVVAVSRIVLDNVPHIQAGWVTEGPNLAQLALCFGADDFGGVLMEERVVKETGVSYEINVDKAVYYIKETGKKAIQRTTLYEEIKEW